MITYTESTGGSGGYTTIQEEGTSLPQRTTMDFVGAGVTVTDNGSKTVVTINGTSITVVSLLNSAMLSLITAGTVVVGQFYIITDATYSNGGGVLVQGVTTKSITRSGAGLFWNADYQGVGNYSTVVPTYVQNKGIWGSYVGASAVIGDTVVYNNRNYVNLTGNWGTAPSTDAVNWQLLTYSATQGYIFEVDFVLYDVNANNIIYRADKRNNEVDLYDNTSDGYNTLNNFQWGKDTTSYNKVKGKSNCLITNSSATFTGNFIENGTLNDATVNLTAGSVLYNNITEGGLIQSLRTSGVIQGNTVSGVSSILYFAYLTSSSICTDNVVSQASLLQFFNEVNNSTISKNNLISNSQVNSTGSISVNNLTLTNGYFSNVGILTFVDVTTAVITGCEVSDGITASLGTLSSATYLNKKVYKGYSNWEVTLNALDIFTEPVLNINPQYAYVGIFTLTNILGLLIDTIVNLPTNHIVTLKPANSNNFRIPAVSVSTATTNQIIANDSSSVGSNTYYGRVNGCDEAIFQKYGTFVGLTVKNVWI